MNRLVRRRALVVLIAGVLLVAQPAPASAGLIRGIQYLLAGVLETPRAAIAGTLQAPIVGTALGAMGGAVRSVGYLSRGVLEVVGGVIPLAFKLIPILPFFL